MTPNDTKWPFKLKRRQFPLSICFAMAINKSQRRSLKKVGVYLPKQIFCHGQLYVAFSRVTTRNGLKVLTYGDECSQGNLEKTFFTKKFSNQKVCISNSLCIYRYLK
jgi:ATP-dependent exoDNAse (exonuclease V) alpha subunit